MRYFKFLLILLSLGFSLTNQIPSSAQVSEEWIYYSSNVDDSYEVFRIHPDGTQKQQLTFDSEYDYFQSVSPDGQWLIVQHSDGENYYLKRISLIDGTIDQLTNLLSRFESWSPDGQSFIYTIFAETGQELWRMNWTDKSTNLVAKLTNFPKWSNDGEWIIFVYNENYNIYKVRINGKDLQVLTNLPKIQRVIQDLSPDGQWLIFGSRDSSEDYHLYRVRLDGSGLEQLTFESGTQQRVNWTVDDDWMIYHAETHISGQPISPRINRMNFNTLEIEELIEEPAFFIGFLPNNDWLIWMSETSRTGTLYTFSLNDKKLNPIEQLADIGFPELSPDGEWLIYQEPFDRSLHIASIDGTQKYTLVSGDRAYNFEYWQSISSNN